MKFTYVLVLAFGSGWSTATAQSAHFSGAQSSGNFGSVNVGSSSSTLSLPFTFDSGGKLGSIRVVTQGALGLDFNDAGTGTCQAGTDYTAGQTCTIDAIFTPKFAGVRYGAALLIDGNGNAIATGYVHGSGVGPQMGFSTGSNS